jgi:GNAT superfamily N-acetyltransferase
MMTIKKVGSKAELAKFIDFPHELYKDDVHYVPELHIAQRDIFTPGKHPFHEHSTLQAFLLYNNDKIIGRIAAILNNNYNQFNHCHEGFFGFFEVIENKQAAKMLFDAAEEWLKEKKVTAILGPANPTTNDPTGLLIDGFDAPPVAMMTYNKPYYASLLEELGYKKKTDLLAYDLPTQTVDQRSVKLRASLEQRLQHKGIVVRPINMKDFNNEVEKLLQVYNAAWDKNLGFVPMTEAEFRYLAKDLKMILDKDFCLVAEHNGKMIGFALAIPDINQILIKIKKGRLLPTGIFKLLLGKKKIDYVRVLALGVTEPYRKLGIEACFYARIIEKAKGKNIRGGEASWILEDNEMMNKGLEHLNAKLYKRYRVVEKIVS